MNISVNIDRNWLKEFNERINNDGPWDSWELFNLHLQAEASKVIPDFNQLLCLRHLPTLEPYEHQTNTALQVLNEMRGRAILADEVGLGKTIEAGLVMKEYMVRGLAKKILVLVPASLVLQWTRELNTKFGIPAVAHKKEWMWEQYDIIVASIDTAKREPHRNHVLNTYYDMLVIDEAHKLKNNRTKNWQFVNDLKKKYCLLLTATPVQNDMSELFNLVSLLKPGQLGAYGNYNQEYVAGKRTPKNEEILKEEMSKIMIRNKRSDGMIHFPKRIVKTIEIELSPEEKALYDGVNRFVRGTYQTSVPGLNNSLSLLTLQREICSSRNAAFMTMVNLYEKAELGSPLREYIDGLVQLARQIKANTKAEEVVKLILEIQDKVIIFTEYRATQEYLQNILNSHGITSVLFRGGFRRNKKDWMMELFEKRAQVMIATEAGGEGINLQFCNQIINYDLPWNPMRIEQRIGRVHRLGQKRDVHIYNFATKGTIEAHILNLLYEKINMFELVISELDPILDKLNWKDSIEDEISRLVAGAQSDEEVARHIEQLSHQFTNVKEHMRKTQGQDTLGLMS